MRRWLSWLILALALPAQAKSHQSKVMVLDLPPVEAVSPSTLKTLDDYLAGAVRDQDFDVVTPGQIGAVLGIEKQRQLLGCAESSCLAELGGALGVDFIVMGSIAVLESDTVITLTAVNQKGTAVGSQRKLVKGKSIEGLLPAMDELVPKLMNQARGGVPAPNLAAATPSAPPQPAGGLESHPATASATPTGAFVLMGAGAATVLASVVVGLMAKSSQSQAETDARCPERPI
jgi:hypothetical protein